MVSSSMYLERTAGDLFVVRGGICDGARIRVDRRPVAENKRSSYGSPLPSEDGWRVVSEGRASINDLEAGEVLHPMIDTPTALNRHSGHDARNALEQYFGLEAVVQTIERANYAPLLSRHCLDTVRTVRPDYPDPPSRVQRWPSGEWTHEYDGVWRISSVGLTKLRAAPNGAARVAALEFAILRAVEDHECHGWFTPNWHSLESFPWYEALPEVSGISVVGTARKRAEEPGVHVVRRLTVEITAKGLRDERRRMRVPMWLANHKTLLVEDGFEPTVEDVAGLIRASSTGGGYGHDYEAEAVKLLGQAGERAIHEEMERKFTEELSARVGPDLEVTVSIRPKEEGAV